MLHRKEIDFLRAIAVLSVLLFHAGFSVFSGGFVGVDIFFVISGYLITSIILKEMDQGTFSFLRFYERRARRILPALFVVILVCLPFASLLLLPKDLSEFAKSITKVLFFISNIFFHKQNNYFDSDSELKPLLHTWSLSVEEQFYLLFPLIIFGFFLARKKLIFFGLASIFLISFIMATSKVVTNQSAAFYLLPYRIWELLLGALIAKLHLSQVSAPLSKNKFIPLIGLALILGSIILFDKQTPFPSYYALIPTVGAGLIIYSKDEAQIRKIFHNRVLGFVGLISYSLYLWHQPILAFLRHYTGESLTNTEIAFALSITFVISCLSWKFIELPFRDSSKVGRKSFFVYLSILATTLFTFGLLGKQTNGMLYRDFDPLILNLEKLKGESGSNSDCQKAIDKNFSLNHECLLGEVGKAPSFIIIGDSHASALAKSLDEVAKESNISGYLYYTNGCPPLQGGESSLSESKRKTCGQIRHNFFAKLDTKEIPNTVILAARWNLYINQDYFDNTEGGVEKKGRKFFWHAPNYQTIGDKEATIQSYIESVEKILQSGRRVILVYPVPEMGWNVPYKLQRIYKKNGQLGESDGSISHTLYIDRSKVTKNTFSKINSKNLVRIEPESIFCNTLVPNRCVSHINSQSLYYDDDHLSFTGATYVSRKIAPYLMIN